MADIDYDKLKKAMGIADPNPASKFLPDVPPISEADIVKQVMASTPDAIKTRAEAQSNAPLSYKVGQAVKGLVPTEPIVSPLQAAVKTGYQNLKNVVAGASGADYTPPATTREPASTGVTPAPYGAGSDISQDQVDTGGAQTMQIPVADLSGYDTAIQGYKDLGKVQEQAYADMAKQREDIAGQMEKNRLAQQARVDEYNAKLNKSVEDYKKMNVSIDNFWAERATGSKILAGIGIILGSIGQAKGAQTNTGLDVIMRAIDQDLAIQRANIEKAGRGIEMEKGILAEQMKNFKDIDDAAIASKLVFIQSLEDKLKSKSSVPLNDILAGQLKAQKQMLGIKLQENALKKAGSDEGLQATFDQLDMLATQGEKLGLTAKIPLTDAQDRLKIINAGILRAVSLSGVPTRTAKDVAKAFFIDTNDLVGGGFKKKIEALKEELRVTAINKGKGGGVEKAIRDAVDDEVK